ncbi:MAG: class I SAM-dependent methyltransferase [Candidatus Zixiibacteriota bacterium]
MNRELNNAIRWVLENFLPAMIRDRKWFINPLMRLYFGRNWRTYAHFKADAVKMTSEDFARVYAGIKLPSAMRRPTDSNEACVRQILADVRPYQSVLDAGCGRGFLVGQIAQVVPHVAGADIFLQPGLAAKYPQVRFEQADVGALPFADKSFDAVVSTHTLEHVRDLDLAMAELRRVARHLVIVVVPRERPYRETLNLHLHFFPYVESFPIAIKAGPRDFDCFELGGDIYYRERLPVQGGSAQEP